MNAQPNPKKLYGDKKPALHLLPLAGMIEQSLAHMDGDYKYGFENWNELPVEKLTYIGAALRHIELYKYGETHARDTGVHNLGGVMACCAILLDAELNGNLIDNAKHSKATCDLLHAAEAVVTRLKEAQAKRERDKMDQSWADAAIDPGGYSNTGKRCGVDCGCVGACPHGGHLLSGCLVPIDDAGGDAPVEVEWWNCKDCTTLRSCQHDSKCSLAIRALGSVG